MHTPVAPNVHTPRSGDSPPKAQEPLRSMNREFQTRFTAGLLILLTTAAVVLGLDQFPEGTRFPDPLGWRLVGGAESAMAAWSQIG